MSWTCIFATYGPSFILVFMSMELDTDTCQFALDNASAAAARSCRLKNQKHDLQPPGSQKKAAVVTGGSRRKKREEQDNELTLGTRDMAPRESPRCLHKTPLRSFVARWAQGEDLPELPSMELIIEDPKGLRLLAAQGGRGG